MNFTQSQNYEILENIINHGSGIEEILRMSLEILMKAERQRHNFSNGDLSNGYRFRKTYGQGKLLELKVPENTQQRELLSYDIRIVARPGRRSEADSLQTVWCRADYRASRRLVRRNIRKDIQQQPSEQDVRLRPRRGGSMADKKIG